MNYYNPYFSALSYTPTLGTVSNQTTSRGLLGSLFGGGKISSFINGTQKTLGIINQAIPLVKQVSPIVKNAKTMFRVMNEFKKVDKSSTQNEINDSISTSNTPSESDIPTIKNTEAVSNITSKNNDGPTFFL